MENILAFYRSIYAESIQHLLRGEFYLFFDSFGIGYYWVSIFAINVIPLRGIVGTTLKGISNSGISETENK